MTGRPPNLRPDSRPAGYRVSSCCGRARFSRRVLLDSEGRSWPRPAGVEGAQTSGDHSEERARQMRLQVVDSANVHSFGKAQLEVEANLRSDGARCYVVRAAKRGQEVVQRVVVRQVNDVQLCAPLVFVRLKQVVISDRQVEETSRCNALRIMVVVFLAGCGDRKSTRLN